MNAARFCPECGTALLPDSPLGVCPRCAFNVARQNAGDGRLEPTISSSDRDSHAFVAPKPDQLASYFPQLEILDLIGQGGMGAVYKARQRGLDRYVALKILPPDASRDPSFAERFNREARALAKLNHPNIVAVFDFNQAGGLYYLLMEYVDGVNLRQAIQAGTLSPKEALAIVPQICDALQYAHDEGVVHRDIKPENILLDHKGRVKIADFGLARLLGKTPDMLTLTGTHQVMGTPKYMAPEQLQGTHEVDHRADIFSLGVVFYEMLTNDLPIGRFPPPSKKVQVDVRLDEVVLRTLEREPNLRYQQASEIKSAVEDITGISRLPPHIRRAFGYEYRSPSGILGIPWLHIAYGVDPMTHRRRVAKGIVAVGDIAVGVIAQGGVAFGILAFGGVAVGLLTLGGLSIGLLLAYGGAALGLGLSVGGFAVGTIAFGGCAVGLYAMGGAAFGLHAVGGNAGDRVAAEFFTGWWKPVFWGMVVLSLAMPIWGVLTKILTNLSMKWPNAADHPPAPAPIKPQPDRPREPQIGKSFATGCAVVMVGMLLCGLPIAGLMALVGFYLLAFDQSVVVDRQRAQVETQAATVAAEDALRTTESPYGTIELENTGTRPSPEPVKHLGIVWTEAGPEILLASGAEAMSAEEQKRINTILREAFDEYLELEAASRLVVTNGPGGLTVSIQVPAKSIEDLAKRTWEQLSQQASHDQLRSQLRLYPPDAGQVAEGGSLTQLLIPGVLGWGSHPTRIELTRLPGRYVWSLQTQGQSYGATGQTLPASLQRFHKLFPNP